MDTRGKSNMEFRNDVQEALARHESTFDQIHNNLQTLMTELQSLRVSGSQNNQPLDNPFAAEIHITNLLNSTIPKTTSITSLLTTTQSVSSFPFLNSMAKTQLDGF